MTGYARRMIAFENVRQVMAGEYGGMHTKQDAWMVFELAMREERLEAMEQAAKHCLCTRNKEGFDYGELHEKLGRPRVGARWMTPLELAETCRDHIHAEPSDVL